jgi:hypothetical protein
MFNKFFTIYTLLFGLTFCASAQEPRSRLLLIEQNGKTGYIDRTGRIAIAPQFDFGWNFSEGFACVVVNGKVGFIDETGNYLVKPMFNSSIGCYTEFHDGFASVSIGNSRKNNEKWGFVNTKDEVIYLPGVTFLSNFHDGLAFFKKDGLTGYLDKNLQVIIAPKFKSSGSFYFGRARATDVDGSQYYIDETGTKLFDNLDGGEFQDKKAFFKSKGKYGFIDINGKTIIKAQFEDATHFGEGLAGVQVGGKWGFIDGSGKMVIPPQFDAVGVFSEGFASVAIDDKWGFIDRTGNIVIPPQFDRWTYWFEDGIAYVRLRGKAGYIDKQGNFIWYPSK